jgi:hypothetical protein
MFARCPNLAIQALMLPEAVARPDARYRFSPTDQ